MCDTFNEDSVVICFVCGEARSTASICEEKARRRAKKIAKIEELVYKFLYKMAVTTFVIGLLLSLIIVGGAIAQKPAKQEGKMLLNNLLVLKRDGLFNKMKTISRNKDEILHEVDVMLQENKKNNFNTILKSLSNGWIQVVEEHGPDRKTKLIFGRLPKIGDYIPDHVYDIAKGFVIVDEHGYFVFDEYATWVQARDRCERLGGHLVTITSLNEQRIIEKLLLNVGDKNVYWIGLQKIHGVPNWITDEQFEYSNWFIGEPNGDYETYGEMYRFDSSYGEAYSWNDSTNEGNGSEFHETSNHGFICEFDFTSYPKYYAQEGIDKSKTNITVIIENITGKIRTIWPIEKNGNFEVLKVCIKEHLILRNDNIVRSIERNTLDLAISDNVKLIARKAKIQIDYAITKATEFFDDIITYVERK